MVTIKVKKYIEPRKQEASEKIQRILIDKGFYATLDQTLELWKMHSESWRYNWIDIGGYTDQEIYEKIKPYFEPMQGTSEYTRPFYLQE